MIWGQEQRVRIDTTSRVKPFSHLDFAITAGISGIGFDFAAPLSKVLTLRAGFAYMPHFDVTMNFGVQVGEDASTSSAKFQKLSGILEQLTGYQVKESVNMIGSPTYYHGKLLLDIYPFHNKHWRFTGGAYFGNTTFAKAINSTEDMTTLVSVGFYNSIYNKVENFEPLIVYEGNEIYLDPAIEDKILSYGRMGMYIGDYAYDTTTKDANGNTVTHEAGSPYIMEPAADGTVRTEVKVSAIRPYVGFGYTGALDKRYQRLQVGFDCGIMFWGGTPKIVTHDGTDLAEDLVHVRGKVGRFVDAISVFKMCPMIDFRIAYRLF